MTEEVKVKRRTHCRMGHEFTPENTYYSPSRPNSRKCLICHRMGAAAYAAKRRAKQNPIRHQHKGDEK